MVPPPRMSPNVLLETSALHIHQSGLKLRGRGKVRDIYETGGETGGRLLIVATDRISAFDYILQSGIPDKGRVLTQLSIFWFDFLRDVTPTHFLTARLDEYPSPLPQF